VLDRANFAKSCVVAFVLAAPAVVLLLADTDPVDQMRYAVVASVAMELLLIGTVSAAMLMSLENFGLRLELFSVALAILGALVLDVMVMVGYPANKALHMLLVFLCHTWVFNATLAIPLAKSLCPPRAGRHRPSIVAPALRPEPALPLPEDLSLRQVLQSASLLELFRTFMVQEFKVCA